MKIKKETWKSILKVIVTVITTVAGVFGVQAMNL